MSQNITKETLAEALAATTLVKNKYQAEKIVELVFAQIANGLAHGKTVRLTKTGSLSIKEVAERERRNPKTGETFMKPAHKRVKFSMSKNLKESLAA